MRSVNVEAIVFESTDPLGYGELFREATDFINQLELAGGYVMDVGLNFGSSDLTGEVDVTMTVYYEAFHSPIAQNND